MSAQKIALITGGSRGLGANTVIALAQRGVDSVFTYHSNKAAADTVCEQVSALGAKAVALPLDVGNSSQFMTFRGQLISVLEQHWQRSSFDYLVNNAGHGINRPFAEITEEDMDSLYKVHLKGPYFLTQTLLPVIKDGGNIVNISTGLTRFSVPGYSAYASVKGAVEVMSRYQAKELGQRGIRVNAIAPGAILTDFRDGSLRESPDMQNLLTANTALGRVGEADDIGPMIASLLADDNRWVTAQRIEVSGGMFI